MRRLLACSTRVSSQFTAVVLLRKRPKAPPIRLPTGRKLSWDVVSVKPNKSLDPSEFMRMTADGVELRNSTLHAVSSQCLRDKVRKPDRRLSLMGEL